MHHAIPRKCLTCKSLLKEAKIPSMRKWTVLLILVALLGIAAFVCIKFYEFVFAKTISGEIVKVERVNQNQSLITGGNRPVPAEQLFSFGVAIRGTGGEIHTASSEDRQWSVAQPGQCAEARFFPYPPWDLQAAGTYHNARLLKLYDCPKK
jgi:hypothetical protein